jgi:hypothetical protein
MSNIVDCKGGAEGGTPAHRCLAILMYWLPALLDEVLLLMKDTHRQFI